MSGWQKAALHWVEEKPADGGPVCELIYELDEEPDSLRRMVVPKADLFEGIRRGARILVNVEDNAVRPS
jgi:hypothetical protein